MNTPYCSEVMEQALIEASRAHLALESDKVKQSRNRMIFTVWSAFIAFAPPTDIKK